MMQVMMMVQWAVGYDDGGAVGYGDGAVSSGAVVHMCRCADVQIDHRLSSE